MNHALLVLTLTYSLACGGSSGTTADGGGHSPSATTSPGPRPIQCQNTTCDVCCANGVCATKEECDNTPGAGSTLFCDGPEDCAAGEACCAGQPAGSFPTRAACTPAAECADLPMPLYFCHTDGECGFGKACAPWDLAPWVSVCGPG